MTEYPSKSDTVRLEPRASHSQPSSLERGTDPRARLYPVRLLSQAQEAAKMSPRGPACGLTLGALQGGAWLEKTDGLLGWVEKDDILVALSFHFDTPGEDATVTFVWGEMGSDTAEERSE